MDITVATAVAESVRRERYPGAEVFLLAGSVARGEATQTSDLDLVVILPAVDAAFRESFRAGSWPVEVFVHDRATFTYFCREVDRPAGIPSLANMVAEAVELPSPSAAGAAIKALAVAMLDEGPIPWSAADRDRSRYDLTNLLDDLRAPRSPDEATAILTALYPALANHYLRSRGLWSARGKAVLRALAGHDTAFADRFRAAFAGAFSGDDTGPVQWLAAEVLARDGGELFDGYRHTAPADWRSAD